MNLFHQHHYHRQEVVAEHLCGTPKLARWLCCDCGRVRIAAWFQPYFDFLMHEYVSEPIAEESTR